VSVFVRYIFKLVMKFFHKLICQDMLGIGEHDIDILLFLYINSNEMICMDTYYFFFCCRAIFDEQIRCLIFSFIEIVLFTLCHMLTTN
jgi:hypothetical protein